jgi:hypothetical protein
MIGASHSVSCDELALDARERACFAVAKEILADKGLSDASYAAAEKTIAAGEPGRAGRNGRQLLDDPPDRHHVSNRPSDHGPDAAGGIVQVFPPRSVR